MDAYLDEMRQGIDIEAGQALTFGDGILHKLPTIKINPGHAMPEEDMDKFLAEVNRQDDKWRAALLTLIGSGIRIGGLLALEWNDIDIENNTIDINKTVSRTKEKGLIVNAPKSDALAAIIPMPEVVASAIKSHRTSQAALLLKEGKGRDEQTLVFPSTTNTIMFPRNFQHKYFGLLKKRNKQGM